MKLKDRVAIVTGGGTGIGKASAIRFAQEGARVAVAGRRPGPLNEVVAQIEAIGGEAVAVSADVGQPDGCRKAIDETVSRFGGLDVLFNNAAQTYLQKTVEETTVEEWDDCLNATLRSVFLMSKYAAPEMRKAGRGSIINCASVGAVTPWRGGAAYCAAKSGILALTKVLAIEYGPWHIRVNTLSPGAIMTPNLEAAIERNQSGERLRAKCVFGRIGKPEEIAAAAVFLASDDASFVSTANLVVDGGWLTL
ncbi:MAG: glucose 1-dehydrogenase [Phycisphaerae bacterium]|nr:glucose 1-dehydrogenase [Phycisphaerae bacterium]